MKEYVIRGQSNILGHPHDFRFIVIILFGNLGKLSRFQRITGEGKAQHRRTLDKWEVTAKQEDCEQVGKK